MNKNAVSVQRAGIVILSTLACLLMIFAETVLQPEYFLKSLIKILIFGAAILLFRRYFDIHISMIKFDSRKLKRCIFLGALLYGAILAAWFLFSGFIDPDQIRESLLNKEHISRDNFLPVAAYITIVNSLIEEIFFRGFVFLSLRQAGCEKASYLISAGLFSVYHTGIISGWFSVFMYILILAALFAGGLILNRFAKWGDSFVYSWIIHISANLGINTIGFMIL